MTLQPLPFDAALRDYERQADHLLEAWRAADPGAMQLVRYKHPRFLRSDIPWAPRRMSDAEARALPFDGDDARTTVARAYDFAGWEALAAHVAAVTREGSDAWRFESAVEAVVDGDLGALTRLLREDASLTRARSARVTCFDPPIHEATLLHYVAANGVEGHRQRTPANAVDVARALLDAGADPNALAGMYGGRHATMPLLVSSDPPAKAGVQVALIDVLVDFGASVEAIGDGAWRSPLMTALAFGFREAAEALVRRGARADSLPAAAGLGRADAVRRQLAEADAPDRHRALALAAQHGHLDIVRALLDAGEDPDRFNPPGHHAHSTPLHQAVWAGHEAVVRLLVERGARLDIRDTIHESTPLGWAEYGRRGVIAEFLRSRGAA